MGSLVSRFCSLTLTIINKMKTVFILLSLAISYSLAEQTCLQGWRMHKMHTGDGPERCHCYYFADENSYVNHADAQAICTGRGGWLVEVDDTDWHHVDNGWIVDTLLDIYYSDPNNPKRPLLEGNQADLDGPHYEDQWWIGARSYTGHSENIPENGYGSTPTPLFNGLIGPQINLMIITDNNAWLTFDTHPLV